MPPGEDHLRGAGGGLFNKIKRYSNVSHKLMRRSNHGHHTISVPRKHSPHRTTCGSYDMTGDSSKDLRPEIGAPVLITTTALDIDKISPIEEKRAIPQSVIPMSSSESETEIFADAASSLKDLGNIKFSFFENGQLPPSSFNASTSTEEGEYEVVPMQRFTVVQHQSLQDNAMQTPDPPPLRKNRSKSVNNLTNPRKLEAVPARHPLSTVDLPGLCDNDVDNYDTSGYYNEPAADESGSDKENSHHAQFACKDDKRNTKWCANRGPEEEFSEFKRSLSAIILHQAQTKCYEDVSLTPEKPQNKSVLLQDTKAQSSDVNDEAADRASHKSFSSVSCLSDDFDLKSASFEDLQENRQLFLSIEEFNALTQEIKDKEEEFNNSITVIDREYCEHRSNLRPSERRVTLMRNKTNKIHLNLTDKKEKISSVWSGFKHWIDEERGKIKEVVQRHSAMQRVGANLKSPTKSSDDAEGGGAAMAMDVDSPREKCRSIAETAEESTDIDNATEGGPRQQQRDSGRRSEDRDAFSTLLLRQKSKSNTSAVSATAEVIVIIIISCLVIQVQILAEIYCSPVQRWLAWFYLNKLSLYSSQIGSQVKADSCLDIEHN